jgi:CMP/dCMP kinase
LGYRYLDTGALYRAVAYELRLQQIDPQNDRDLQRLCQSLQLSFSEGSKLPRLISNGKDITDRIRSPEIAMLASAVSAKPIVRETLLHLQRKLGEKKALICEGRDMGTVVFPDADVKFFLEAALKTRAVRRYAELKSQTNQSLQDVERDMQRRDRNDRSRQVSPLQPAVDAIIIDSTAMTVMEVVDVMLTHINNRVCSD